MNHDEENAKLLIFLVITFFYVKMEFTDILDPSTNIFILRP
jgi:hypothetical protein